jgi:DHA1 family bicyclomycin/chloramphenicol resistance-like MFS transporter
MGPIALYSFGVAFIMPAMLTNSLMPFPTIAGAASALTAFLQMAIGLLGSALAALFTDPSLALAVILPVMGIVAAVCWHFWRKLPVPNLGRR